MSAQAPSKAAVALRWTGAVLVAVTWISAAIFGAYILAFYGGSLADDAPERWNESLPGLYSARTPAATAGMAAHFLGGGVLLMLGPIQLIARVRERFLGAHRWIGRAFVAAAALTAAGGLAFIAFKGTIGGAGMDVGFGLYGVLMLLAAAQTVRHVRAKRLDAHRAWAIRLFALVIGSWLYRIDYGFWFMLTDGAGHTDAFDGPFDFVMDFWFYAPNLLVAEAFVRARGEGEKPTAALVAAAVAVAAATAVLLVGTYFFTRYYWGPEILARF